MSRSLFTVMTVVALAAASGGCRPAAPASAQPSATPSSTPAGVSAPVSTASAAPSNGASPSPSTVPPTGAAPTATVYVVQPGDALSAIAARFGITVDQLLAANPQVSDPDDIRAGDRLTIPPRDAPTGLPRSGRVLDASGDVLDEDGQEAFAPAYVDLAALGALVSRDVLTIEIRGGSAPPEADPTIEAVTYTVHVDTNGDDMPEARVRYTNTGAGGTYVPAFAVIRGGEAVPAPAFPGRAVIDAPHVRFEIRRDAFGDSRRFAIAASIERRYSPGAIGDAETETARDALPDQQWPRPNPRWLEVGIGG